MLKYIFYPGCVSEQLEKESYVAAKLVCTELDIELIEDNRMSCCGATHVDKVNNYLNLLVNARNMAFAEENGLAVLTICNTCLNVMKRVAYKLKNDSELFNRVNKDLEKVGLKYEGTCEVKTLLEVLFVDFGLENLRERIINPLKKFKVAPYYGCHILRPKKEIGFDNALNPNSFEQLLDVLGAKSIEFDSRLDCCGFHITMANPNACAKMNSSILKSAKLSGANCIATPCPLCHMVFDSQQFKANKVAGRDLELPAFHLQQLVGLALGISSDKLMLKRHVVSCSGFV